MLLCTAIALLPLFATASGGVHLSGHARLMDNARSVWGAFPAMPVPVSFSPEATETSDATLFPLSEGGVPEQLAQVSVPETLSSVFVPVSAPLPQAPVIASSTKPLPFDSIVQAVAAELDLDAALLHAVIQAESSYNAKAVSPRGAIGLMQVMPKTGARFGHRRLADPKVNVRAGATYLRWLLEKFDDDLVLALAAYNAGEGAVLRHGRKIPPYRETQAYVRKVMNDYRSRSEAAPAELAMPVPQKTPNPMAAETWQWVKRFGGWWVAGPNGAVQATRGIVSATDVRVDNRS